MGIRLERYKSRMMSQAAINTVENDIAEGEEFLRDNPEDTHPTRMLRHAVAEMRQNLADLQQNHYRYFRSARRAR